MLVVGAGRSGTSLITGVLSELDFHVPQPEVVANRTNPRGFGEPRWVVDFHARLMSGRRVALFDARPVAWTAAAKAAASSTHQDTLRHWMAAEFEGYPRLVVKDPRTAWFLPLWTATAAELGARTSFVTMLRHPSEVLTSIRTTAGEPPNESGRAAWWTSTMLRTELITRPYPRTYLPYERLLADWRSALVPVGEAAAAPVVVDPPAEMAARIDALVDPGLRRSVAGWDAVTVTAAVRDLAEQTWQALSRLAEPGGDTAELRDELDQLRGGYDAMYADAEAVAGSSVTAAVAKERRSAGAAKAGGSGSAPAPGPKAGKPSRSLRSRVVRKARRLLSG